MTAETVARIVAQRQFPGPLTGISLVETHISWVILTNTYAFKLKKPVQFSFLDFSTVEQRKFFIEQELRLNRRLAPQVYLDILPVGAGGIGDSTAPIEDYALQMRRMDNTREMDRLLERNAVTPADMEHLAALLSDFHREHRLPSATDFDLERHIGDFADLFSFSDDLIRLGMPDAAPLLHDWQTSIPAFLQTHGPRLVARQQAGYWVEGHGDLHSRNIFLPEDQPPIVFDCLEFNEYYRRMDVLNELAFLCMDLEYFGRGDLADHFIRQYVGAWNCFETPEDRALFIYFKAYRANIRLKVTLLQGRQHPEAPRPEIALRYWLLLRGYCRQL
jgi:uncharacterized protein